MSVAGSSQRPASGMPQDYARSRSPGSPPRSPGNTLSRLGSPARATKVQRKAATDNTLQRLPREGPAPGKGCLFVLDRAMWGEFTDLQPDLPEGLQGKSRSDTKSQADGKSEKSAKKSKSGIRGSSIRSRSEESPRSALGLQNSKDKPRMTPEERKRAEIMCKLSKVEAQRHRDLKDMMEVVEKRHERRGDRFERLLENVTGRDNLAYRTAMALRERQDHEDKRRRELHENWDAQVYQPLALQAYEHMNPPSRLMKQMVTGSKNVGFMLPDSKKTLVANVDGDPNRKPVLEMAKENAFHQAASAVLGKSYSAPLLMSGHVLPRARSRPTLEPELYSQGKLQGTMFGHFAQIAEQGANFKRSRRGGTDIHIPDEADGVEAVGKRKTRSFGRHDLGILKGDTAAQGETASFKSSWGAASGAPAQDHFTYDQGMRVTDIEFPLGKRMFAEFH